MSGALYPRVFEGEALKSLGIDPVVARIVKRVKVVDATTMVIELDNQTIAVDVQAPIASGRPWTIKVEHTFLTSGRNAVVAEAHPVKAVNPSLPDGEIISIAIELAGMSEARAEQRQVAAEAFVAALDWVAPGAIPSPKVVVAVADGRATVGYELNGADVIVTLRINAGPLGPKASDLFR